MVSGVKIDSQRMRLLLRDCANGFYQQMYFLGRDVAHPRGNQLQVYGFEKSPSLGLKGTSCYTLVEAEKVVELYGSCAAVYTADFDLVFLRKRCRFYHWVASKRLVAGNWSQQDLVGDQPFQIFRSLVVLLNWWIAYEKWIEERFGKDYRKSCYAEWRRAQKSLAWLSPEAAVEWIEHFIERGDKHVRPKHFKARL